MNGEIDVEVVQETDGFERLKPAWEECFERSPRSTIFSTWTWLFHWWIHYGESKELRILVARRGHRVVGILPLYCAPQPLLSNTLGRVCRFVGTGGDTSPDYLGPIADEESEPGCSRALARFVVGRLTWDGLDLSELAERTVLESELAAACTESSAWVRSGAVGRIALVRLPSTFEEYLMSLSRHRRHHVRKSRRKAERDAGGRFFVWSDENRLDEAVDQLAELHRKRWAGRAERHAFSSDAYTAFHRSLMHELLRRNQLRLYALEGREGMIAMLYCYSLRGEVFYFQGGFDPAYERLRPGLGLTGYAIEEAIREGATVFDMLKGEYEYKDAWANDSRGISRLLAARPTLKGRLFRLKRHEIPALRARIGSLLRRERKDEPQAAAENEDE